jgi:hypothetical protein
MSVNHTVIITSMDICRMSEENKYDLRCPGRAWTYQNLPEGFNSIIFFGHAMFPLHIIPSTCPH